MVLVDVDIQADIDDGYAYFSITNNFGTPSPSISGTVSLYDIYTTFSPLSIYNDPPQTTGQLQVQWGWLKFTGITVPQGATINDATVTLQVRLETNSVQNFHLTLFQNNSPITVTTDTTFADYLALTTNIGQPADFTISQSLYTYKQNTFDVKTIVQELVDNFDFNNQDMMFRIKGHEEIIATNMSIKGFGAGGSDIPNLTFNYSTGATTKTFTINAIVVSRITETFEINAILKGTQTETFSIDAILDVVIPAQTFDINALLLATQTETLDINARLFNRNTETLDIDAVIISLNTKTLFIDSVLKGFGLTEDFIVDTLLQVINTKDFIVDAIIDDPSAVTEDFIIDALITGTLEILKPISDISNTGVWEDTTFGNSDTQLWNELDEISPDDDASAVLSKIEPTGSDTFEVKLQGSGEPDTDFNHKIRFRARGTGGGEQIKAQLYEGVTLIAESGVEVLTTSYQTFVYVLTTGEAGAITDYSDLRIRMVPV